MIKFNKNNIVSAKASSKRILEDENEDSLSDLNILKPKSSIKCISEYNRKVNKITNQLSEKSLNTTDMCIIKSIIDLDIQMNLNEDFKGD